MVRNLYRDLTIWQRSIELIKQVYAYAGTLPKEEEFNLKQQLRRAVVSVSLNIAEGKNRRTSKDFANFLNIACSSLAETEAILLICAELGYATVPEKLFVDIEVLSKMINSLISKLRRRDKSEK
jgi:four helix bundle protein